jgi:OOP family OmpA-OmpF porin
MKRTAMAGLLALASFAATAHDVPGWRIGGAASFSTFQGDDTITPSLGDKFIDDSSVGLKIYAQYQFNDWLGVEGAYHNLGSFKQLSTSDAAPGDLKITFDGFSIDGLVYLPIGTEELQPYLKAGYYDFDDQFSVNGATTSNGSESGLTAGGGVMISLADKFGIRADLDWFDADVGTLWAVNLGLEYFFGGEKPVAVAPVAVAAAPVAAAPPPPADTDGDGVVDTDDQCPDTPQGERVGPYGCSCDVTRQVEFAFDSADLTDAGKATLDEVAERLTQLKFVEGTVTGYTDNVGDPAYNQKLSERRAQTVADYLQQKGIASGRLAAAGKGEEDPVADNATAEGRAQNRRVVLRRTDCDAPK